jgi:hypothetical protein
MPMPTRRPPSRAAPASRAARRTRRFERELEHARVVAAVVDARRSASRTGTRPRDQVAAADLGRVEAELSSRLVERPLGLEVDLLAAVAAVRARSAPCSRRRRRGGARRRDAVRPDVVAERTVRGRRLGART